MALHVVVSCSYDSKMPLHDSVMAAIEDSIGSHSPNTFKIITDSMSNAADSLEYYEYASRLAKYYLLSATPDSALPLMMRIEKFVGNPSTPRERFLLGYTYNAHAGFYHNFHKNTRRSEELYEKAYKLIMESDHKEQAPDVCANLGDAYVYESKLPEAASCYRRALFLADSLKLPANKSVSLYVGLAYIYQQLGDDTKALNLYKLSDKHFDDMTVNMQSYFLTNYGSFYYYLKDYSSSLSVFNRLKQHLERNGKTATFDMYLCKLNLADIYLNLGNINEAKEYLDEVEPYWKKTGDDAALYYCHSIRLGILVAEGNLAEADRIATEKMDGNTLEGIREIRDRYMRAYYIKKHDWKSAYENLQADIAHKDSLERDRNNMRAADIMAQYTQDTLRLHTSLIMEHKDSEVAHARLWIVGLTASAIVLVMIILVLVTGSRRKSLRSQMQVMQLRLENARNRISPHFVFNVLNNRIVDAGEKEAGELLDLTKLIRANLDMAGTMTVTLAEEIDFVDKYIKVESKLLEGDNFEYKLDIADGIDTKLVRIPSMFIQILVENSFVHGLMGRKDKKELNVTVSRDGLSTVIEVVDNGPGFDIRNVQSQRRTGLNVIRQTIAVINERNRHKIEFIIHNLNDDNGKITGCIAKLVVPDGVKYLD